jgi:hypothetical protein
MTEEQKEKRKEYKKKWHLDHLEQERESNKRSCSKRRESRKAEFRRYYDLHKRYTKAYRLRNPEKIKEANKKWKIEHEIEIKAERKAQYAIPIGEVCATCGKKAQERHHPDYTKPLDVVFLCKSCHKQFHVKRRKIT